MMLGLSHLGFFQIMSAVGQCNMRKRLWVVTQRLGTIWTELGIVSMRQNIRTNLITYMSPPGQIGFQVKLSSRPNTTVQRNPAHYFRINEMALILSYFPDPAICLLPMRTNMLHQQTHHCPQWPFKLFTITLEATVTPVQVNAI